MGTRSSARDSEPLPQGLAYEALSLVVTTVFMEQKLPGAFSTVDPTGEWPARLRTIAKLAAVDRSLRALVQGEFEAMRGRMCDRGAEGAFVVEDPKRAALGSGFGRRYLPFSTLAEAHSVLGKTCVFCGCSRRLGDEWGGGPITSSGVHLLRLTPGGESPFPFLLTGKPTSNLEDAKDDWGGDHLGFYQCSASDCRGRDAFVLMNRNWGEEDVCERTRSLHRAISKANLWEQKDLPIVSLKYQYSFLHSAPVAFPMLQRASFDSNPLVGEVFHSEERSRIERTILRKAAVDDAVSHARLSSESIKELNAICPSLVNGWTRDRMTRVLDHPFSSVQAACRQLGDVLRTIHLWRVAGVPLGGRRQEGVLFAFWVEGYIAKEVLHLADVGVARGLPSAETMKAHLAHQPGVGGSMRATFLHVLWSHRRNAPLVELELAWAHTHHCAREVSMRFIVKPGEGAIAPFDALKRDSDRQKGDRRKLSEVREAAAEHFFTAMQSGEWAWQTLQLGGSREGIAVADATVGDMLGASRYTAPLALILRSCEFPRLKDLQCLHNMDARHEVRVVRSRRLLA